MEVFRLNLGHSVSLWVLFFHLFWKRTFGISGMVFLWTTLYPCLFTTWVVVWRNGNALVSINEVNLR